MQELQKNKMTTGDLGELRLICKKAVVFRKLKILGILINCVDFCHDSAKHASMMALAAPKVEKSWEKRWEIQLFGFLLTVVFAGTDSSATLVLILRCYQLDDYLMTTW